MNIAKLNDSDQYISLNSKIIVNTNSTLINNLPIVEKGKQFIQLKPKFIIYSDLILLQNNQTNEYEATVGNAISVIDGYIDIDLNFCIM